MNFDTCFFETEVRNDFTVSGLMKRAWATQMEVLQAVADVCTRHDIPWFSDWGTLLGAVRHHGFVPWDDDIDIAVKRADYDRLIPLLRTELPDDFVLIGIYADAEHLHPIPHSRVITNDKDRDLEKYMKRFHGFPFHYAGIDICPLDYIPRDLEKRKLINSKLNRINQVILKLDVEEPKDSSPLSECEQELCEIEALCNTSIPRDDSAVYELWRLFDSLSAGCREEEADHLADYDLWFSDPGRLLRKEWYEDIIYLPFETISMPVPVGYDDVLTATYGDYHTPVKFIQAHDYPFYKDQKIQLEKIFKEKGINKSVEQFCKDFMDHVADDTGSVREKLIQMSEFFYQRRSQEGLALLPETVERLLKIPESAEYIEPLLDAIEQGDYVLAADICYHEIARRIT